MVKGTGKDQKWKKSNSIWFLKGVWKGWMGERIMWEDAKVRVVEGWWELGLESCHKERGREAD